jgi:hypothetical protein
MEERIQSVLFMRHAVALHNVATLHHSLSTDAAWVDPELTPYGKLQAVVAGGMIRTRWSSILRHLETTESSSFMSTDNTTITAADAVVAVAGSDYRRGRVGCLELVVASPLTRCLQTATLAFLPPLMDYNDNDANDNGCAAPSLPPRSAIAMVCKEEVREAFGIQYPDRRRCKSVLQVRDGSCALRASVHRPLSFTACVAAAAVPLSGKGGGCARARVSAALASTAPAVVVGTTCVPAARLALLLFLGALLLCIYI